MANLHLLHENYVDTSILLGGQWVESLPLAFLKTQLVSQVARSVNTSAASTRIEIDLGRIRPVSQVAFVGHNLSQNASVTIYAEASPQETGYSWEVAVRRPNVPWGSMPWGEIPWDGFLQDRMSPVGTPVLLHEITNTVFVRYIYIDIADTANPAGFVQLARLMIGEPWVPRINMAYGAASGIIDVSTAAASRGGQKFWDRLAKRRKLAVQLNFLTEGEALGAIYDMQARIGLTGNLLVSYDPAEGSAVRQRRTLYASLTQLDDTVTASASIDYPYSCNLSFEEII